MTEEQGGTVTYHRADYRPGTDEPWLVWFTEDQDDPYWFTAEQGEAMGLTPPEPAPLVVTRNGHRIELSDEQAGEYVDLWDGVVGGTLYGNAAVKLAGLLRDARQDPQPTAEPTVTVKLPRNIKLSVWRALHEAVARAEGEIELSGFTITNDEPFPIYTLTLGAWDDAQPRRHPDGSVYFDGTEVLPALSPRQCLEALLAGRDDADELIAHPYRHQVSWLSIIGDAAHGGA